MIGCSFDSGVDMSKGQQRFLFDDADLTTPQHDQIMLWFDANARRLLAPWIPVERAADPTFRLVTEWEVPVMNRNNGYVHGFLDMRVEVWVADDGDGYWNRFHIEVKSTIPSLGELVRQLKLYQQYLGPQPGQFIIVSPDVRYAAKLRELGFGFIEYVP